ncbi:FKBP-type peptidyl-prolyl cis-trans isomerase [Mucilaginibacter gossypiicola]|uniref:Peptidyl-prolyl cis-trans isomerase n=1 Tax=Mucilaginibacter gossypiicola TaxID=551995 RepID=A0A1H8Q0H7_9SPHI|nr:FKBP-type peptidyl-prolyl cis-trans isomerase [Mucilaginibacter gossypiicola]SEO47447.1 FKBP-type peptidyl-prolyl cis-trans isomerase [Mucilaginibacter gossypiicola]
MKQTIFTLLVLISIGFMSCRKDRNDPDIKQYDQTQIQNYISANGITGMLRDTTDGDTTGIYYKILSQGRGTPMDYSDQISFVFTVRSLDGKFISLDSLNANHFFGYLGHVSSSLPKGVQIAIHNLIKYKGTAARVIVPSHLAYGVNGYGSGSSSNANTHIAGNQSLDYYINVVSNQEVYDDAIINNYIKAKSLTGFTKTADGVYIKIATPGTGSDQINADSYITCTYSGKCLNDVVFDSTTLQGATSSSFTVNGLVTGVQEGLKGQTAGSAVSIIIPSRFGYGTTGSGTSISANTVLYFDFTVATVSN